MKRANTYYAITKTSLREVWLLCSKRATVLWRALLLAVLLLAAGYGYAQVNTSTAPYLDSWHLYRIPMGNVADSVSWHLNQDDPDSPSDSYHLTDGLTEGSEVWVDTSIVNISGTWYQDIEIKFLTTNAKFQAGEKWFLVYTETNAATGSCEALRSLEINPVDNDFYFNMPGDKMVCNGLADSVLNGDSVVASAKMATFVVFDLYISKNTDHWTDSLRFDGQITPAAAASYLVGDVSIQSSGTSLTQTEDWTVIDHGNGSFSFNLDCVPDDAKYTNDTLSIMVYLLGEVTEEVDVTFTLTNGEAYSGSESSYIVETDDNVLLGDKSQTITMYRLPGTANITMSQ